MNTQPHLGPLLFTADQVQHRVEALADDLARDYGPGDLLAVALLKGSFIFVADLIRHLSARKVHPVVDFLALSSYGAGTASQGHVAIRNELSLPVAGRRVLLIDDILDTGHTLQTASRLLVERGASEVRTCVLLDKPSRRIVPITANYVGFQVPNVFVVGYGLDYDNRYRHLPCLTTLTPPISP